MGLFSRKPLDPREYTFNGSYGTVYLLDKVVASRKLQDDLCKLLTQGAQSHKTMKQLVLTAYETIETYDRNAYKCLENAKSTSDPDAYFRYLGEAMKWYADIAQIEKYVYNGIMPAEISIYKVNKRQQIEIRHLIDRSYAQATSNASRCNTKELKDHCFVRAYNDLKKYKPQFDAASTNKLEKKFSKYIPLA